VLHSFRAVHSFLAVHFFLVLRSFLAGHCFLAAHSFLVLPSFLAAHSFLVLPSFPAAHSFLVLRSFPAVHSFLVLHSFLAVHCFLAFHGFLVPLVSELHPRVLDAKVHHSEQHGSSHNHLGLYKLSEQPQAFWIVCPWFLGQERMPSADGQLAPHSVQLSQVDAFVDFG
jgi:hypothetical protein